MFCSHYDVTGKICPNPYVYNHTAHTWDQFLAVSPSLRGKRNPAGRKRTEDGAFTTAIPDCRSVMTGLNWDGHWYWFNGAGLMIADEWYEYKGYWYYFGPDGAMVTGLDRIQEKWYYFDQEGRMATEPVTLVPDSDGALQFPS